MAKKKTNHSETIRTLVKGITQIAGDVKSERERAALQVVFARVANSIASNPELATEKNIDMLARLLNVDSDPEFTGMVVVGLSAIATRIDVSFDAAYHVEKIFTGALKDADMRRGIEYGLMNGLMDIVKKDNSFAHDAAGGLLSFLYEGENQVFASIAGSYLAEIALNASGTLRTAIKDALHNASNDGRGAIRVGGEAGLRVLRFSKLETLKNLAATLPAPTPSS